MKLGDAWGAETSPTGIEGAYVNEIAALVPEIEGAARVQRGPNETLLDSVFRVANQYIQTDAQRRLLDMQIQRAAQGLPPMKINPETQGRAEIDPRWIFGGALALAAVFALRKR